MKDTNRYIALALCFSLTLGAFVYRPPEAQAIAGVDDAVVIGALLTAFSAGCGLIFANNGMTSNEIAQGMTQKWNEYKETLSTVPSSFASWLGFDSFEELLASCVIVGPSKLSITRAVARKFSEFTTWLTENLGVTAGGDSASVAGGSHVTLYQMSYQSGLGMVKDRSISVALSSYSNNRYDFSLGSPVCSILDLPASKDDALTFGFTDKVYSKLYAVDSGSAFSIGSGYLMGSGSMNWEIRGYSKSKLASNDIYLFRNEGSSYYWLGIILYENVNGERVRRVETLLRGLLDASNIDVALTNSRLSVFAPSYYKNPTIDLPAEGEEAVNPTLSGVGDGTATSIEELLQKILEQLQANTLSPTLDLAGTEIGGNTGTDEDAKPYLPYIPQIFEKIKDLPGTLSNIWETIKGIPAAIAEKIGAFFTTLWGWLQSIIDAIKALPAAIAEKIKALFVPREGYAAEFVADITATYQGRMGLLTYPFTVLADFVGTVATLEEQEPVLRWDAVEWQNKTIIAAGEYNLKSAVSSAQMQTVYMIYKTVVSGMLVVAFLHLCYKKLKEVQRN